MASPSLLALTLMLVAVLSRCGTYITISHRLGNTIAVAFIDTSMKIRMLALIGNALLILDSDELVAWHLTEEGVVGGVLIDGRTGRGDSIWTESACDLTFLVEDQTVVIKQKDDVHLYHIGTGEVSEPAKAPLHPHGRQYSFGDMLFGHHYPHHYELLDKQGIPPKGDQPISSTILQYRWIKDPEGKHRLWTPVEWRAHLHIRGWFYHQVDGPVTVTF